MSEGCVDSIPVAHTPSDGYGDTVPEPILAGCLDPLAAEAPDLRGWWTIVEVGVDGDPQPDHPSLGRTGLPIEVRRWREGDHMMWQYVGFTARLARQGPPT